MSTLEDIQKELDASQAEANEVKARVANVAGDVDSLIQQVAALKQQAEQGGGVSASDLSRLLTQVQGVKQTLTEAKTSLEETDAKEPAPQTSTEAGTVTEGHKDSETGSAAAASEAEAAAASEAEAAAASEAEAAAASEAEAAADKNNGLDSDSSGSNS